MMRSWFLLLGSTLAFAAHAETSWISVCNGQACVWSEAAHWTNGVPTLGESALFARPMSGLDTIDLSAGGYAADVKMESGYLFVNGGLNAGSFRVTTPGSLGLGAVGSAATLTTGTLDLAYGANSGYGDLFVARGSRVAVTGLVDALRVGRTSLSLDGATLTAAGGAVVDGGSTGLRLKNGAVAQIGGGLALGSAARDGKMSLETGSQARVDGALTVRYGKLTSRDSGLTVGQGLTVRDEFAQTGGQTRVGGDLTTLSYHGWLTLDKGAQVSVDGNAALGGMTLLQGTGSALSVTGDATVGSTGIVMGAGRLKSRRLVNDGIVFASGGGSLAMEGDLVNGARGTLAFLVTPTGAAQILVSGKAALGGQAHLDVAPGATFQEGDRLDLLVAQGGLTGTFSGLDWTGGGTWSLGYEGDRAFARFGSPQAVPEPASLAALGLGALALVRRRRR